MVIPIIPARYQSRGEAIYTAVFAPNQYTISTSAENGYVEGAGEYDYGTSATLTAIADEHYHFERWSDGNTDNPRVVSVEEDASYTAEFAIDRFTITATAEGNGYVSGDGTYDYGVEVILYAIADEHYHFDHWDDGNTDNPRTMILEYDASYVAIFAPNQYTIYADAINGYVEGAGEYDYGTTIILTATANEHYHFVQWNDGNTDNPRTITIEGDATYTAEFAKIKNIVVSDSMTVAEALAVANSLEAGAVTSQTATVIGYVSQIKTAYSEQYGDVSFYMSDDATATTGDFLAYRVKGDDAAKVKVGNKVKVTAQLINYKGTTPETVAGGTVEIIGADEVETINGVTVVASTNDAAFTWPAEEQASTYTIVISKNGVVFCTLTFNANGQLMSIAFAPSPDGTTPNRAAEGTISGFRFTVSGLEEGSTYAYSVTARDADGNLLYNYTGEFTTENETALAQVELDGLYTTAGHIVCDGEFQIFDLLGRDVTRLNGSLNGVYIVKVGEKVQKVVVK